MLESPKRFPLNSMVVINDKFFHFVLIKLHGICLKVKDCVHFQTAIERIASSSLNVLSAMGSPPGSVFMMSFLLFFPTKPVSVLSSVMVGPHF